MVRTNLIVLLSVQLYTVYCRLSVDSFLALVQMVVLVGVDALAE